MEVERGSSEKRKSFRWRRWQGLMSLWTDIHFTSTHHIWSDWGQKQPADLQTAAAWVAQMHTCSLRERINHRRQTPATGETWTRAEAKVIPAHRRLASNVGLFSLFLTELIKCHFVFVQGKKGCRDWTLVKALFLFRVHVRNPGGRASLSGCSYPKSSWSSVSSEAEGSIWLKNDWRTPSSRPARHAGRV